MTIQPNKEAEFNGRYIAHWEVERIEVDVGERLFGLLHQTEAWMPSFPDGFDLPGQEKLRGEWHRHPSRSFKIRFVGIPTERGRFGHMGICDRRVAVRKVLELIEISKD